MRSPIRWTFRLLLASLAAGAGLTLAAHSVRAGISAPPAGSTQAGDVTLAESRGGVIRDPMCPYAFSSIFVYRARDNALVFSEGRMLPGPWETTWISHGQEIGTYRIVSAAQEFEYDEGSESCVGMTVPLSSQTFTLRNAAAVADAGSDVFEYYDELFFVGAQLTDATTGRPITGKPVVLELVGGASTTVTTNGSGAVSATLHAVLLPGPHKIRMTFASDCCWVGTILELDFRILKRPTTLTHTGDAEVFYDEKAGVHAELVDTRRASPFAGEFVYFQLRDGGVTIRETGRKTDALGIAESEILADVLPKPYDVRARFLGTDIYEPASDMEGLLVKKRPTLLTADVPVNVVYNEPATLKATLSDNRNGEKLGGREVTFRFGVASTKLTGADGVATAVLQADMKPGTHPVKSSYAGNDYFEDSVVDDTIDVLKRPTVMTYTGAPAVYFAEPAGLGSVLTDGLSGAPLGGMGVTFTVGGAFRASVTTGADGGADATLTLDDAPGRYEVRAKFAEDDFFTGSSAAGLLDVLRRPTALSYTGATSGVAGSSATLSAVLMDSRAGTPLREKPVTFLLGSLRATAGTDASGTARVDTVLDGPPGSAPVEARFDPDSLYEGSSAGATFFVAEYQFADALGRGTVYLAPSLRSFRLETPEGITPVVHDPGMQDLPGGVVQMAFAGADLTLAGAFSTATGAFSAFAQTTFGTYELHSAV